MAYNPLVPAARFSKSAARNRRMVNWATTQDAAAKAHDFRDITSASLPLATILDAPVAVGDEWFGGISTTAGAAWVVTPTSGVQRGGTVYSYMIFTGAGSWAHMKAGNVSGTLMWVVIASNGVSA